MPGVDSTSITVMGDVIVLTVSHGLVTVLETLKNVLRTINEDQERAILFPPT